MPPPFYRKDETQRKSDAIFPAQLGGRSSGTFIAQTQSGGTPFLSGAISTSGWYEWTEQGYSLSGTLLPLQYPRQGLINQSGTFIAPAQELNQFIVQSGTYVLMRSRSYVGGVISYEFSQGSQFIGARMELNTSIVASGSAGGVTTNIPFDTVIYDQNNFIPLTSGGITSGNLFQIWYPGYYEVRLNIPVSIGFNPVLSGLFLSANIYHQTSGGGSIQQFAYDDVVVPNHLFVFGSTLKPCGTHYFNYSDQAAFYFSNFSISGGPVTLQDEGSGDSFFAEIKWLGK